MLSGWALEHVHVYLQYVRNVLFEYMMGRQKGTLTRVLATAMRFTPEQSSRVLSRERSHAPLTGFLLASAAAPACPPLAANAVALAASARRSPAASAAAAAAVTAQPVSSSYGSFGGRRAANAAPPPTSNNSNSFR